MRRFFCSALCVIGLSAAATPSRADFLLDDYEKTAISPEFQAMLSDAELFYRAFACGVIPDPTGYINGRAIDLTHAVRGMHNGVPAQVLFAESLKDAREKGLAEARNPGTCNDLRRMPEIAASMMQDMAQITPRR